VLRALFQLHATTPTSVGVVGAADTVLVPPSPLPGGIAEVVRFLFNFPQWAQIAGAGAGLLLGLVVLVVLWRRRREIQLWLLTRPRGVQASLAGGALFFVLVGAGVGRVSWNYMQHDNSFCTGCHIMESPFSRFQEGAGKHDTLSCHNCHQQSIFASARELYLWVAERPVEIQTHSPVPTAICAGCHVTGDPEKWQRIAGTAGHRTHLESDSTDLKDVLCVTCHGLEVHQFVPVDKTCGQSGCHENTEIKLGGMADQTSLHCATCHEFTLDVPALATRDSAAGTLRPNNTQCLGCHEMREVLADFIPELDPHQGTCGMCHNPHTQEQPSDAKATCTSAGCHDNTETEPFHTGRDHRSVRQECTTCHIPHRAKVDASDCAGCHESIRVRTARRPPLPFDTTAALRTVPPPSRTEAPVSSPAGQGDASDDEGRPPPVPWPRARQAALLDTFPHPRHTSLACLTCHVASDRHGGLTFERPRGCQICHHQQPATRDCSACHTDGTVPQAVSRTVTVTTRDHAPRPREAVFRHEVHTAKECTVCHTTPVTLGPQADVLQCQACHEDHHADGPNCATCHALPAAVLTEAHRPPETSHVACDACHTPATVARLVPTRPLCATCHQDKASEHYPAKECATCHFLTSPESYRSHLRRATE